MPTSFQVIDRWIYRAASAVSILIPGIASLFFIDLNVNIFRGEFGFTDFTNFNSLILYYVDKIDLSGQHSMIYGTVTLLLVYVIGYFLNSSSKFFTGPRRFRAWFKVEDSSNHGLTELPQSVKSFLQLNETPSSASANEQTCLALISSAGLMSSLSGIARRIDFYRTMGYLFCVMALLDVCMFIISFDFSDFVTKASLMIFNLTFAFLFFKGQDESAHQHTDTLVAEAMIAAARLRR